MKFIVLISGARCTIRLTVFENAYGVYDITGRKSVRRWKIIVARRDARRVPLRLRTPYPPYEIGFRTLTRIVLTNICLHRRVYVCVSACVGPRAETYSRRGDHSRILAYKQDAYN